MVLFAVEGGEKKGYGHVVRALVLARTCVERGLDISFACTDADTASLLRARGEGFQVSIVMPSKLIDHALMVNPHVLIADIGKTFTSEEVTVLHQAGIFVIECDAANRTSSADEVINGFEPMLYGAKGHRYRLTGRDYFIVDETFAKTRSLRERQAPTNEVRGLFVCFGGSDPEGLLENTLRHVMEIPACLNVTINAVAGFSEAKGRAIAKHFSRLSGLQVYVGADAVMVSELMMSSDLGIVSFGSILVEALCTELPVFMINPTRAHEEYAAKVLTGIFAGAGKTFGFPPRVNWDIFREELSSIMQEPKRIAPMQHAARGLVDGRGAQRIADHIRTLVARRPSRYSKMRYLAAR